MFFQVCGNIRIYDIRCVSIQVILSDLMLSYNNKYYFQNPICHQLVNLFTYNKDPYTHIADTDREDGGSMAEQYFRGQEQ